MHALSSRPAGPARAPVVRGARALPRPLAAPPAATKFTLYGSPGSRAAMVEWGAEELGVKLDVRNLDMRGKKEHKDPEYVKKVHPFGQVPALAVYDSDGDAEPRFTLFESGAILSYLAEKAGRLPDAESRAVADQWILFANSTLAQALFFDGPRERALPSILASLDALLGERPFLAGEEFTVADVAVGAYFSYIPRFLGDKVDLSPYKNVVAYVDRVLSRPAAKKTIAA